MANSNFDLDELFDGDYFASWPAGQAPATLFTDPNSNPMMNSNSMGSMSSLNPLPVDANNSSTTSNSNNSNDGGQPEYNALYDPRNVPTMMAANPLPRDDGRPKRGTKSKVVDSPPEPTKRPPKRKAKTNPKTPLDEYDDDGVAPYKMSEAQKVERRSRNREHAKRSRLRKKFLLESLQSQIDALEKENGMLRSTVMKEVGAGPANQARGKKIMREICIECGITVPDELKDDGGKAGQSDFTPLTVPSGFGPVNTLMEPDLRLINALSTSQQNFAISDPTLPDNPIVYVSQGFLDLTGYKLDQVLGRNCRFLQGPDTDQKAVEVIRRGVEKGVDTSICLLNYKADGTPFWNQFFVACLRDSNGTVVNFVGVQCEVSKATVESQFKKRNA